MIPIKKKEHSEFVQTSIHFDSDIAELERLSKAIQDIPLEKESEIVRAQKLILHFSECGLRVGDGVKVLAKELESARLRAEKAAAIVSARAVDFQACQEKMSEMLNRFKSLGDAARALTSEIAEARAADRSEEKKSISNYLPELDSRLEILLKDAKQLRDDARTANIKSLEQNAERLSQDLGAAIKRLKTVG